MLEVNSHKLLKKYYQNNLALWPHNLTLTRLISRSLSRKDNTFIQLSSDSKDFWFFVGATDVVILTDSFCVYLPVFVFSRKKGCMQCEHACKVNILQ